MLLAGPILVAYVAAAIVPVAFRRWPRATAGAAVAVPATLFLAYLGRGGAIVRGEIPTLSLAWVPALDVAAAFRLDGLSLVFALAITGVGALVIAYSPPYLSWEPRLGRLLGLLLAFLASMLGLVLADDTITMFVFWELTSVASFFLIAFAGTEVARRNARQALLVTSGAGLAMLVGLLLLARAASPGAPLSTTLSSLPTADVRSHAHYTAIVVAIAIGAFAKSAQVPLHFWLPSAMVAPSPVSAFLHSATMVKAGVYLLARLHPALGGTPLWMGLLGTVGAVTCVVGGVLATVQRDLKLSLAYATICVLGALILLIGVGTELAIGAAVVLLVAHIAYKAALFLVVGNVDHVHASRDPFADHSAARDMPASAGAAALAAASMAGVPLLLGFLAKDALLAANLHASWPGVLATIAVIVAGVALVTTALLVGYAQFWHVEGPRWSWGDAPAGMLVGPAVLALAGLVLGVVPGIVLGPLATSAATAIAGAPVTLELSAWPHLEGPHAIAVGLGLASLGAGTLGYLLIARHRDEVWRLRTHASRLAAARGYELAMRALDRTATWSTRVVQHGRLRGYVIVVVATVVVAAALPLLVLGGLEGRATVELRAYEVPVAVLAVAGAAAAAVFRDRYAAIAALATTGISIAFLFALFSGPDVAITQLAVETMMLILLVLAVRRLRLDAPRPRVHHRVAHAVVAGAAGVVLAGLLLVATSGPPFVPQASRGDVELARASEVHNVVNYILVNFRAIDTLGEISVLAIAGVGVLSLLRHWRR